MPTLNDEITAIEKGFWIHADDGSYFTNNIVEGGLSVIEPMGFVERDQVAKNPAEAPWRDVEMLDLKIRQVTPDVVILAYHGRGRTDGQDAPYEGSIASTYVRQDGKWKMAISSHQPWKPAPPKKT